MTGEGIAQWVIHVSVVAASVTILLKCVVSSYRFVKRIDDGLAELKPNGGSSLRDAVNRIEERLDSHDARLESIEGSLHTK